MRLKAIKPEQMTAEQRSLHDEMVPQVDAHLAGFGFETGTDDGALIGPFVPMLAYPDWGGGVWEQTKAMLAHTVLPKPAHEIAILVTGAAHRTRYELYAHERVAEHTALSAAKVAAVVAGQRPGDLDEEEAAAHDLAAALVRGGPVPDATFAQAQQAFGDEGAAELVFLVAAYCSVSVLLNGFAMPVPGGDV